MLCVLPELRRTLNSDVCARCACSMKGFPRSRWRAKSASIGAVFDAGAGGSAEVADWVVPGVACKGCANSTVGWS